MTIKQTHPYHEYSVLRKEFQNMQVESLIQTKPRENLWTSAQYVIHAWPSLVWLTGSTGTDCLDPSKTQLRVFINSWAKFWACPFPYGRRTCHSRCVPLWGKLCSWSNMWKLSCAFPDWRCALLPLCIMQGTKQVPKSWSWHRSADSLWFEPFQRTWFHRAAWNCRKAFSGDLCRHGGYAYPSASIVDINVR